MGWKKGEARERAQAAARRWLSHYEKHHRISPDLSMIKNHPAVGFDRTGFCDFTRRDPAASRPLRARMRHRLQTTRQHLRLHVERKIQIGATLETDRTVVSTTQLAIQRPVLDGFKELVDMIFPESTRPAKERRRVLE